MCIQHNKLQKYDRSSATTKQCMPTVEILGTHNCIWACMFVCAWALNLITDSRLLAEMVLPLLFLSLFFHSKEPSNLSPHSGGILSISSPSIRGTSCFHIHGVCVRGGKGEGDMFSNNSVINDASCSHANLAICNYSVLTSDRSSVNQKGFCKKYIIAYSLSFCFPYCCNMRAVLSN